MASHFCSKLAEEEVGGDMNNFNDEDWEKYDEVLEEIKIETRTDEMLELEIK